MFADAGTLYVYFTYGMHWLANISCGPEGQAAAVLLRAGEVVEGVELAWARRPAAQRNVDLARGPARLTTALGIDGSMDGMDVCARASSLRLYETGTESGGVLGAGSTVPHGAPAAAGISVGPRVGIKGAAAERPWRFWIDGAPTVSRWRAGGPANRSTGRRRYDRDH